MPMIQIEKIQNSFLIILLSMASMDYILVKFTVHIVHIDSYGAKINIDQLHNGLDVISVFNQPDQPQRMSSNWYAK